MALERADIDRRDVTVSAGSAAAVTPNDTTEILSGSRGIYVGVAGNLVVTLERDSSSVTFVGVLAGSVLPIRVRLVHTASTAASIVALY